MQFPSLTVIIISIRVVFLRIWRHLLQFSRKINGGAKFSEIKVQKTRVVMFVIDWNLARHIGKTYCVRKWKKKWISWIWSQWHLKWFIFFTANLAIWQELLKFAYLKLFLHIRRFHECSLSLPCSEKYKSSIGRNDVTKRWPGCRVLFKMAAAMLNFWYGTSVSG